MNIQTKGGYIESYDVRQLNETDLKVFHDIERDTRSYFFGEYVKCVNEQCGSILSKSDIYSLKDESYKEKTVAELEQKFGTDISCSKCGGETEFMWGDDTKEENRIRMMNSVDAYISVYKNKTGQVLGLVHGYVDKLETILDRELKYHFNNEFMKEFEDLYDKLFVIISGLCIQEKNKNIYVIYELVKHFFNSIDSKYDNIYGITESKVGSPIYNMTLGMGAVPLDLPNKGSSFYIHNIEEVKAKTDILLQTSPVARYKSIKNLNLPEFMRYTQKQQLTVSSIIGLFSNKYGLV